MASATQIKLTSMGTMTQYILLVEREYKHCNGPALARLLSLRDEHVLNDKLSNSTDATLLVGSNCLPPMDKIVMAHMLCIKAIFTQNFVAAYNLQTECVEFVIEVLQSHDEQNWFLPVLFAVCMDLRQVAQKADAILTTPQTRGKVLEKAAQTLLIGFRVCATDNYASDANTKKIGMLNIVNQLLKIYFRIDKIQQCKPLIRAIESSPLKSKFCRAQMVTFKFFVGRIAVYESDYHTANKALSAAFVECQKDSMKNKRMILTYLVPVKMMLGYVPTKRMLEKYEMMDLWELARAVKEGNLEAMDKLMVEHDKFFKTVGIFITVEKLRLIAQSNLYSAYE